MRILMMIMVLFMVFPQFAAYTDVAEGDKRTTEVKWYTWTDMQETIKNDPRKVFVMVYTKDCPDCNKMNETLDDAAIAENLNSDFVCVRFNAETKQTIKFKGVDFNWVENGRNSYHELAAVLLRGRLTYPSSVFLDESLNLITVMPGYLDSDKFNKVITQVKDVESIRL